VVRSSVQWRAVVMVSAESGQVYVPLMTVSFSRGSVAAKNYRHLCVT
jgi:hypothetical protein